MMRLLEDEQLLSHVQSLVWCYDEVTSTMEIAREHLQDISLGHTGLVTARSQTRGRGRQGRNWENPLIGFMGTFISRSNLPVSHYSGFSLATGCVIAEAIESFGCVVGLKWPNDVLSLDGRKLSGVLIELVPNSDEMVVLTGIGTNLSGEPSLSKSPQGALQAVDLSALIGRPITVTQFAQELIPRFLEMIRRFDKEGFRVFRERWLAKALWLDLPIRVRQGESLVEGKLSSIDEQGSLILRQGHTDILIHSGEVVIRDEERK